MFEYNGENYDLKFNLERIKVVENYLKMPVVADIVRTNGALPISSIETYFGYCLKKEGSDSYVSRKEGIEICDAIIEEKGYVAVNNMIIEKMTQDIPFLFQGA